MSAVAAGPTSWGSPSRQVVPAWWPSSVRLGQTQPSFKGNSLPPGFSAMGFSSTLKESFMNGSTTTDFQFYPTPAALAKRMWEKFKNQEITRCLEPSCGNGDLLMGYQHVPLYRGHGRFDRNYEQFFSKCVDACEIDMSKHAHLRELGVNVVGMDFLEYSNGAVYSHILLNPPFADGVKHVLHAWDILWDGEIVALINAETLKNPFSAERQLLARLVDFHGEVEYIADAFMTDEASRKTGVECALVYLKKTAEPTELLDNLSDGLKQDGTDADDLSSGYQKLQELALPTSVIQNQVLIFNCSVKAWKEAILVQARAIQHSQRIGMTLAQSDRNSEGLDVLKADAEYVRKALGDKYQELKDRAWTSILRGSQVTSKLSSAAQKRVESDFENIKRLEFTVSNIHGFLLGIAESAGEIQMSMMCDVFDNIIRYHSDNAVFYRGWKSNDAQRTCGMRVKMRRFILPNFDVSFRSLAWKDQRRLADFDRVFALLDGKSEAPVSLVSLFDTHLDELKSAQRVSSTYFDIRFYKGIQTIHFFPRRADLMDRLNRVVGRHRSWIPSEPMNEAADFWKQYDQAEKLDSELRDAMKKASSAREFGWRDVLGLLAASNAQSGHERAEVDRAQRLFDSVAAEVQLKHGINADRLLESNSTQLLLAA